MRRRRLYVQKQRRRFVTAPSRHRALYHRLRIEKHLARKRGKKLQSKRAALIRMASQRVGAEKSLHAFVRRLTALRVETREQTAADAISRAAVRTTLTRGKPVVTRSMKPYGYFLRLPRVTAKKKEVWHQKKYKIVRRRTPIVVSERIPSAVAAKRARARARRPEKPWQRTRNKRLFTVLRRFRRACTILRLRKNRSKVAERKKAATKSKGVLAAHRHTRTTTYWPVRRYRHYQALLRAQRQGARRARGRALRVAVRLARTRRRLRRYPYIKWAGYRRSTGGDLSWVPLLAALRSRRPTTAQPQSTGKLAQPKVTPPTVLDRIRLLAIRGGAPFNVTRPASLRGTFSPFKRGRGGLLDLFSKNRLPRRAKRLPTSRPYKGERVRALLSGTQKRLQATSTQRRSHTFKSVASRNRQLLSTFARRYNRRLMLPRYAATARMLNRRERLWSTAKRAYFNRVYRRDTEDTLRRVARIRRVTQKNRARRLLRTKRTSPLVARRSTVFRTRQLIRILLRGSRRVRRQRSRGRVRARAELERQLRRRRKTRRVVPVIQKITLPRANRSPLRASPQVEWKRRAWMRTKYYGTLLSARIRARIKSIPAHFKRGDRVMYPAAVNTSRTLLRAILKYTEGVSEAMHRRAVERYRTVIHALLRRSSVLAEKDIYALVQTALTLRPSAGAEERAVLARLLLSRPTRVRQRATVRSEGIMIKPRPPILRRSVLVSRITRVLCGRAVTRAEDQHSKKLSKIHQKMRSALMWKSIKANRPAAMRPLQIKTLKKLAALRLALPQTPHLIGRKREIVKGSAALRIKRTKQTKAGLLFPKTLTLFSATPRVNVYPVSRTVTQTARSLIRRSIRKFAHLKKYTKGKRYWLKHRKLNRINTRRVNRRRPRRMRRLHVRAKRFKKLLAWARTREAQRTTNTAHLRLRLRGIKRGALRLKLPSGRKLVLRNGAFLSTFRAFAGYVVTKERTRTTRAVIRRRSGYRRSRLARIHATPVRPRLLKSACRRKVYKKSKPYRWRLIFRKYRLSTGRIVARQKSFLRNRWRKHRKARQRVRRKAHEVANSFEQKAKRFELLMQRYSRAEKVTKSAPLGPDRASALKIFKKSVRRKAEIVPVHTHPWVDSSRLFQRYGARVKIARRRLLPLWKEQGRWLFTKLWTRRTHGKTRRVLTGDYWHLMRSRGGLGLRKALHVRALDKMQHSTPRINKVRNSRRAHRANLRMLVARVPRKTIRLLLEKYDLRQLKNKTESAPSPEKHPLLQSNGGVSASAKRERSAFSLEVAQAILLQEDASVQKATPAREVKPKATRNDTPAPQKVAVVPEPTTLLVKQKGTGRPPQKVTAPTTASPTPVVTEPPSLISVLPDGRKVICLDTLPTALKDKARIFNKSESTKPAKAHDALVSAVKKMRTELRDKNDDTLSDEERTLNVKLAEELYSLLRLPLKADRDPHTYKTYLQNKEHAAAHAAKTQKSSVPAKKK